MPPTTNAFKTDMRVVFLIVSFVAKLDVENLITFDFCHKNLFFGSRRLLKSPFVGGLSRSFGVRLLFKTKSQKPSSACLDCVSLPDHR